MPNEMAKSNTPPSFPFTHEASQKTETKHLEIANREI
jgi:hypothetical protein